MKKFIGVDPGKHTGMAIVIASATEPCYVFDMWETDFWGCIDRLDAHQDAIVVIELPASKRVWHTGAKTRGAIERTGVNVGSCIREAELLISYLHRKGREYIIQRPAGKLCKASFNKITGWTGQSNQHTRDAGLMAFMYAKAGMTALRINDPSVIESTVSVKSIRPVSQ